MKRKTIVTLFVTLLLFGFLNFVFISFIGVPFSPVAITGYAVNDSGIVQIFIEDVMNIWIFSPENITYNFAKGDPYIIPLNVSSDFTVETDGWSYSLYDLKHGVYVEEDTLFTPNSSISAVRWGNLLTVFAVPDEGGLVNKSVVFYVNVSNSAPLLGNISDPIFVCEGRALDYRINATDVDEDDLVGDISPKNPFYLTSEGREINISFFDIVSAILGKSRVGVYLESISVMDPFGDLDIREVNIEVIEINNPPVLENIGAQTVWLTGDDSVFYHVAVVDDVEDGNVSGGNLEFNLTWAGNENLFDVGFNDGIMNYSPLVGHEGRVYDLQICVEDNPLNSSHKNISLCFPRSNESVIVCDNFSLTVTDENRPPEILDYDPANVTLGVIATQGVEYFVEVYDPDWTIPDIDWYVDNVRVEHNENISNDSFIYDFGCGKSGAHSVRIVTSDGLLNDSQTWYVNLIHVPCPISPPPGGGGGGGGGGSYCLENWVCDDWDVCQSVKRSFDSKLLSLEDYSVAKSACSQNKEEDERFCGFQIKSCYDLNVCGRLKPILPKPVEKRFCYFTENPNCYDGITNCHDNECELLADCGGPCEACPTCSDRKQNQGEAGIDCGGPCPYLCEPEVPFAFLSSVLIVVAIIIIIIIFWISWRLFLLWKRRNDEEE